MGVRPFTFTALCLALLLIIGWTQSMAATCRMIQSGSGCFMQADQTEAASSVAKCHAAGRYAFENSPSDCPGEPASSETTRQAAGPVDSGSCAAKICCQIVTPLLADLIEVHPLLSNAHLSFPEREQPEYSHGAGLFRPPRPALS